MTISQEPVQSEPSGDAPTIRIQPVARPEPTPTPVRRAALRRIARRIVGPNLLTRKK